VNLTDLWDVTGAAEPKVIVDVNGSGTTKMQVVVTEYIMGAQPQAGVNSSPLRSFRRAERMVLMNTITFILDPLKSVFSIIYSFIPTVLGVLAALVVGGLVAREAGKLVAAVLKRIHVDKISHEIGLTHTLEAGGVKRPVSDLIGTVITWGVTITSLVIALTYAGVTIIGPITGPVMAYVPNVLTGVITLMVGMFLAHIVAIFVRLIAANTGMPRPDMLSTFTRWAVVLMAVGVFVDKIGFGFLLTGAPLTMLVGGLSLGLGLAFGLGGKDHATHYLNRLFKK